MTTFMKGLCGSAGPGPLGGRSILRCWYLARWAARTWWMLWDVSNTRPRVFFAQKLHYCYFNAWIEEYLRLFPELIDRCVGEMRAGAAKGAGPCLRLEPGGGPGSRGTVG